MQQFIPFEDEWDMLESLGPAALIPFHIDLSCERGASAPSRQRSAPSRASIVNVTPAATPTRPAAPAGSPRA